ncbi:hypothetical protein F5Y16DRAFT_411871 [Xylariaceae sp. FL0255]|nr:hypothetical protein F5Y16DRAFT_411871 [Xylariaceae sp. FL0255]
MPSIKLNCSFCGVILPGTRNPQWAHFYRAIYCDGFNRYEPRLSGIGFFDQRFRVNHLPPEKHQSFDDDDLDPLSLIDIRSVHGPDPYFYSKGDTYAWGFTIHDACWTLLEQACKPDPVDLHSLWRILISVPAGCDLANWGHNYGGQYTARASEYGSRPIVHRYTLLYLPSTLADPLDVAEIDSLISMLRIDHGDVNPPSVAPPELADSDIFVTIPTEIIHIILAFVESKDILSFRLASRAVASTGLPQSFFRSRFWPGRELESVFEGFLLGPGEATGIDWKSLYCETRRRRKHNMMGIHDLNRQRIWRTAISPLRHTMHDMSRITTWKTGRGTYQSRGEDRSSRGVFDEEYRHVAAMWTGHKNNPAWRNVKQHNSFHVYLFCPPSSRTAELHVTFITFFGYNYITSLSFLQEDGSDFQAGYIAQTREKIILVNDIIEGFHISFDNSGIRGISPLTERSARQEYPVWAGDHENVPVKAVKFQRNVAREILLRFDVGMEPEHVRDGERYGVERTGTSANLYGVGARRIAPEAAEAEAYDLVNAAEMGVVSKKAPNAHAQ